VVFGFGECLSYLSSITPQIEKSSGLRSGEFGGHSSLLTNSGRVKTSPFSHRQQRTKWSSLSLTARSPIACSLTACSLLSRRPTLACGRPWYCCGSLQILWLWLWLREEYCGDTVKYSYVDFWNRRFLLGTSCFCGGWWFLDGIWQVCVRLIAA
jgi:hypothetical protein